MFQSIQTDTTIPVGMPTPKSIRALLLDDSNFDRAHIRRLSHKTSLGVHLDEVGSIAELDNAVRQNTYDLILIDYRLPVGDGMQALSHVLDAPMNRDAGKIMITGDAAIDTAVQAMRSGCHDFLTKADINAETLREAMINAMTNARQKMQLQMQAQHQADIIKKGLVAAFSDSDVQQNVLSIIRNQMATGAATPPRIDQTMDAADIDVLIAGLTEEDEFVFH